MSDKVKIIFLPFLLVFALVLALMVGVKWYFEIANGLIFFDTFKFGICGGSLLTLVLSVIVLEKRLRILHLRGKWGKRNHYAYYLLMVPAIVIPVNFAIAYTGTAGYGLVHVKTADEIRYHKRLYRYYKIDKLQADVASPLIGYDDYIEGGGRNSSYKALVFTCHTLLPVTHPDSLRANQVWLGLYYAERIGANNSADVQMQVFKAFASNSEQRLANAMEDIGKPVYYENPPNNSLRHSFTNLLPDEYMLPQQRTAILCPRYNYFDERDDFYGGGFMITTTVALFFIFLVIAATPISKKRLNEYLKRKG